MWLDAYILLPIITIGIEKLIDKDNKAILTLSLFFAIVTNFYQGYMLFIYTIIYSFFYMFYNSKIDKKNIIKIVKNLSIVLLLSMFILLPILFSIKDVSATFSDIFNIQNNYKFSLTQFITSLFSGSHVTRYSSITREVEGLWANTPNIFTGILQVVFLISFISNNKIDKNNKCLYITILLILTLLFFVPYLDIVMEAFHIPNDMPFRYSYMFSFIMIIISMYTLENIDKKSIIKGIIITLAILLFILIINPVNIDRLITLSNIVILLLYFLFNMFYNDKKLKYLTMICISILVVTECFIGFNLNVVTNNINNVKNDRVIENGVNSIKMRDDYPFYRVESKDRISNLGSTYNIYSVNTFNSMTNKNVAYLTHQLGLGGNGDYYYYYDDGATPVYNTLFDVKYVIGDEEEFFDDVVYKVHKNKYDKGLMFEVSSDILNWNYKDKDPFIVQNDLVNKISKEENIFKNINYKSVNKISDNYYEYEIETDSKYVYVLIDNINIVLHDNTVYYRDTLINNAKNPKLIATKLGLSYEKEEDIELSRIIKLDVGNSKTIGIHYNDDSKQNVKFYTMDYEKYNNFQASIDNSVSLVGLYSDEMLGTIDVKNDNSVIFTSIEANSGWKVYDGEKEIDTLKVGNALLAFKLDKGFHTIYLRYEQPYYNEGLIITSITMILLSVRMIYDNFQKEEEDEDIRIS
jgi:uncharacterized membrane protein YfhO